MNVLFISYDGMTDPLGQSQVIPYLAGLSAKGHSIWLLSCEKPDRFEQRKAFISELLQKHNINWIPIPYHAKPPVLSTIMDIRRIKKEARKLHKEVGLDLLHCRGYISALAGLEMKAAFNVKFLFDMRGFFADERKEGGLWNTSNFVFRKVYEYFKKKEIQFFSNADYSISLTQAGKKIIHSWETVTHQPVPIKVIPCCADLDHFSESSINTDLQKKLKQKFSLLENDFVISYLGSVGTWYMLEEMLDFFAVLKKAKPSAKFLFISGDNPDYILASAQERGIDKIDIIVESSNREDVPTYLSLSDASIFFIKPVFSKQASSPTKMAELMSMGIPIVCNAGVGDVDEIMADSKAGYLLKAFNTEDYQAATDYLLNIAGNYSAQHAKAGAEKYYSLQEGIKRYNEVYTQLSK